MPRPHHTHRASRRLALPLLAVLAAVILGCKLDPLHEDLLVENNTPPPFDGVSNVQLRTYVNKMYIDLLGRGPTQPELDVAMTTLADGDYEPEAREAVVAGLQEDPEWAKNYDALTKARMLNGVDSLLIQSQIQAFETTIQNKLAIGDTLLAFYLEGLQNDLVLLLTSDRELRDGTIDIGEFHRRHLINQFYDEINMGSENFVRATFENFFHRQPTEEELVQSVHMVDGQNAYVFLTDGNSKREFAEIVVRVPSYYEGLVVEAYRNLLARDPYSVEMAQAVALQEDGDYHRVQRTVIISEEYAGF